MRDDEVGGFDQSIERRDIDAVTGDHLIRDARQPRYLRGDRSGWLAQAALDAGKQEIAIARKGLVEADKPLLKDIAAMGVTVTQLTPQECEAFVKATRPVYTKWTSTVGADLVNKAEKAIANRAK